MTYSNVTTNTRVRIRRTLYYLEVKYVEKSSDYWAIVQWLAHNTLTVVVQVRILVAQLTLKINQIMNTLLLFSVILYLVTLISYTFICDYAKIEISINPVSFVITLCPIVNTLYVIYLMRQIPSFSIKNILTNIKRTWTGWCKETFNVNK